MKRSRLCCKCLFLCLTWEQHHPVTRLLAVWGSSAEFALLFTVFVSYFEMPRGLGLHGTNRMNWEVASAVNCDPVPSVLCCDDLLTGCGETARHPCNVHCLLDTAVSAIHLPSFFTSWNKNVHYQHFSAAALFWVRESEATHPADVSVLHQNYLKPWWMKKDKTNDTIQMSEIFIQNIQFTCIRSVVLPSESHCCLNYCPKTVALVQFNSYTYFMSQCVLNNSRTEHISCWQTRCRTKLQQYNKRTVRLKNSSDIKHHINTK